MIDISDQINAWFDEILAKAISSRASDIHIDPERNTIVIRFRIDGLLQVIDHLNKDMQENLISRIKVLAGMNITERRLPQDGRFEMTHLEKMK